MRRTQLRDILLVAPLDRAERARRGAQIHARRRASDHRRVGSMTYNRQQALRLYEQNNR